MEIACEVVCYDSYIEYSMPVERPSNFTRNIQNIEIKVNSILHRLPMQSCAMSPWNRITLN